MPKLKPIWSVEHWHEFGRRCRTLRLRIDTLSRDFPRTRGFHVGHADALAKISLGFAEALVGVENALVRQHPGMYGQSFAIVHGPRGDGPRRDPFAPPWPPPEDLQLSRDEWGVLARELKGILVENESLMLEFGETRGATQNFVKYFVRVGRSIEAARKMLDALARQQHPDWEGFGTRDFYGPRVPPPHGLYRGW